MKKDAPAIPPDKRRHALMGLGLALTAPAFLWLVGTWPALPWLAGLLGAGIATAAGLLKEVYDHYWKGPGKRFDLVDWLYTVAGGLLGGALVWAGLRLTAGVPNLPGILAVLLLVTGAGIGFRLIRRYGL